VEHNPKRPPPDFLTRDLGWPGCQILILFLIFLIFASIVGVGLMEWIYEPQLEQQRQQLTPSSEESSAGSPWEIGRWLSPSSLARAYLGQCASCLRIALSS